MLRNGPCDIEKEPADECLYLQVTELFRQRCGIGDVEEHENPIFPARFVIAAHKEIEQNPPADETPDAQEEGQQKSEAE